MAVVGVGAVGVEMLRVLRQRNFPVGILKVLARSERDITVDSQSYHVERIRPESFEGIDIALFAGTEGEKGAAVIYASEAVKRGALVIDNGADFRMEADVPLVVPEVNPKDAKKAKKGRGIIANPNCSTIQMVVALAPIHKISKIKRIIVATYQAASGAGNVSCPFHIRSFRSAAYRTGSGQAASAVLFVRVESQGGIKLSFYLIGPF